MENLNNKFLEFYNLIAKKNSIKSKISADKFTQTLLNLTSGYKKDPETLIKNGILNSKNSNKNIIEIQNVDFVSICKDHLLPFYGKIWITYKAKNKIASFGSIIKVVNAYSKRLQIQEELTNSIGETLYKYLKPYYLIVKTEGTHLCIITKDNTSKHIIIKTIKNWGELK